MKVEELEDLKKYIEQEDKSNSDVSAAGTYWHLDHIFQVITRISKALIKSDPEEFRGKFKPNWAVIRTAGKIPRGVGRAPKSVQPETEKNASELLEDLANAKSIIERVHTLDKKAHFIHPVFGTLDLKNTLKFLKIHTKHHLKIIDDILK